MPEVSDVTSSVRCRAERLNADVHLAGERTRDRRVGPVDGAARDDAPPTREVQMQKFIAAVALAAVALSAAAPARAATAANSQNGTNSSSAAKEMAPGATLTEPDPATPGVVQVPAPVVVLPAPVVVVRPAPVVVVPADPAQ